MLIGACWPYLDQRPAPPETWVLARGLGPGCVRVCSNVAGEELRAIAREWPGPRFVVRAKLPKLDAWGGRFRAGDRRPDLLEYREWPSEPSPRECLELLLGLGRAVDLELINEPDLEWDDEASWGPLERWVEAAEDCAGYLERQIGQIGAAFGEARGAGQLRLAAPALSEGWAERHAVWLGVWERRVIGLCDAIAVHAYSNGRPFGDRDWGGRPLDYAERFPGRPLLLTETNGNGTNDCPGCYLAWLRAACPAVELACLFALPGQPEVPDWWNLTGGVVERVLADLRLRSGVPGLESGPGHGERGRDREVAMPEYRLGMKAKAEELGREVVGAPLEDEAYITPEYALQFTERGVLVYSKRANRVHFLAAR